MTRIRRTFLDAGVLLAAWDSSKALHGEAVKVLSDPERDFLATSLIELEVLPHAEYQRRLEEVTFMRTYLDECVSESLEVNEQLIKEALALGKQTDITGLDAMHVAAAIRLGADEFITIEKATKPIYREKQVKVIHLSDARSSETSSV